MFVKLSPKDQQQFWQPERPYLMTPVVDVPIFVGRTFPSPAGSLIKCLPMLKHIRWKDVELEKLNPLLDRQMITGKELMLARVLLKKGCVVPEHSHMNEQLTYIVEGALKFWIDGKEIVVSTGEVLCIPPHMPHKAEALVDTIDVDVFYPPRQDWLS